MDDQRTQSSALVDFEAIPIAQIHPGISDPSSKIVDGVITVTWPYSIVKKSVAFILAENDVRLRRDRGYLRLEFHGPAGKALEGLAVGAGDKVRISLEGVEWQRNEAKIRSPGTPLEWQLSFSNRLRLSIQRDESQKTETIDVDASAEAAQESPAPEPDIDVLALFETQQTIEPILPSGTRFGLSTPSKRITPALDQGEYASPAFLKRARVSYGSLFEPGFDIFDEDEGRGKKRRRKSRFSMDSAWRYDSRSPSPEADDVSDKASETEDEAMKEVDGPEIKDTTTTPLRSSMVDQGCQTQDLGYSPSMGVQVAAESRLTGTLIQSTPTPQWRYGDVSGAINAPPALAFDHHVSLNRFHPHNMDGMPQVASQKSPGHDFSFDLSGGHLRHASPSRHLFSTTSAPSAVQAHTEAIASNEYPFSAHDHHHSFEPMPMHIDPSLQFDNIDDHHQQATSALPGGTWETEASTVTYPTLSTRAEEPAKYDSSPLRRHPRIDSTPRSSDMRDASLAHQDRERDLSSDEVYANDHDGEDKGGPYGEKQSQVTYQSSVKDHHTEIWTQRRQSQEVRDYSSGDEESDEEQEDELHRWGHHAQELDTSENELAEDHDTQGHNRYPYSEEENEEVDNEEDEEDVDDDEDYDEDEDDQDDFSEEESSPPPVQAAPKEPVVISLLSDSEDEASEAEAEPKPEVENRWRPIATRPRSESEDVSEDVPENAFEEMSGNASEGVSEDEGAGPIKALENDTVMDESSDESEQDQSSDEEEDEVEMDEGGEEEAGEQEDMKWSATKETAPSLPSRALQTLTQTDGRNSEMTPESRELDNNKANDITITDETLNKEAGVAEDAKLDIHDVVSTPPIHQAILFKHTENDPQDHQEALPLDAANTIDRATGPRSPEVDDVNMESVSVEGPTETVDIEEIKAIDAEDGVSYARIQAEKRVDIEPQEIKEVESMNEPEKVPKGMNHLDIEMEGETVEPPAEDSMNVEIKPQHGQGDQRTIAEEDPDTERIGDREVKDDSRVEEIQEGHRELNQEEPRNEDQLPPENLEEPKTSQVAAQIPSAQEAPDIVDAAAAPPAAQTEEAQVSHPEQIDEDTTGQEPLHSEEMIIADATTHSAEVEAPAGDEEDVEMESEETKEIEEGDDAAAEQQLIEEFAASQPVASQPPCLHSFDGAHDEPSPRHPHDQPELLITVQSLRSHCRRHRKSMSVESHETVDPSVSLARMSPIKSCLVDDDIPDSLWRASRGRPYHLDAGLVLARASDAASDTKSEGKANRRRSDGYEANSRPSSSASKRRSSLASPPISFRATRRKGPQLDISVQLARANGMSPTGSPRVAKSAAPTTARRSPSVEKEEQPEVERESATALKLQLLKSLRISLPDCLPLRSLRNSLNKVTDVFGVATATPAQPHRPKHGPRDYMLEIRLTDPSTAPTGVNMAHIFRPHQTCLPVIQAGDVVLLRRVQVVSMQGRGFGVRAGDASAWAVFEKGDGEMLPQIKGPPMEIGEDEVEQARGLRRWWDALALDEKALDKVKRANDRLSQGKDDSR